MKQQTNKMGQSSKLFFANVSSQISKKMVANSALGIIQPSSKEKKVTSVKAPHDITENASGTATPVMTQT